MFAIGIDSRQWSSSYMREEVQSNFSFTQSQPVAQCHAIRSQARPSRLYDCGSPRGRILKACYVRKLHQSGLVFAHQIKLTFQEGHTEGSIVFG